MPQRLLLLVLLVCPLAVTAGCGEERPPSETQPARPWDGPVLFAGQLQLQGGLARRTQGTVIVEVWCSAAAARGGEPPSLSRRYSLDDPDWRPARSLVTRYFGLSDADRADGRAPRPGTDAWIEARFDPDGLDRTMAGVVRAGTRASSGDREIVLALETPALANPGAESAPRER